MTPPPRPQAPPRPACRQCGATLDSPRAVASEVCAVCLDQMLQEEDRWREPWGPGERR